METVKNILLLVEDNPDDVELTMKALQKNGISSEVAVANDGIEALDYLNGTGKFEGRDFTWMPKVILLDLKMPRMDGIECLRRIRADERTRLIPVVVFTTSNEMGDRIESLMSGANSYVIKPVDYNSLVKTIQRLESYWMLLNETA